MGQEVVVPDKPVKEQIREQKRAVDRSKRQVEREMKRLEAEKKKMQKQIKIFAEKGQHQGAKMLAKQIVQITNQINKMTEFSGQLTAVSLNISGCTSINELMDAMDNAGKAMGLVGTQVEGGKMTQMIKNFSKADSKMEMGQEMMNDILEGMNGGEEDQQASDELYNQVLMDVGLNSDQVLPNSKGNEAEKKEEGKEDNNGEEVDSLEAMLKSLQKKD